MAQKKRKINDLISDLKTQIDEDTPEDTSETAIEADINKENKDLFFSFANGGNLTIGILNENSFDSIPNDSNNLISDIDIGVKILESLSLVQPNIVAISLSVIDTQKSVIKAISDEGKKELLINSGKILIRRAIFDIANYINQTKSLNIPTDDIKNILESISRIFPEVKLPKLTSKNKPRISNKAFKLSAIEPSPNHFTCLDILTLLIKPQEFTDKEDYVQITKNHQTKKARGYTTLKIPKPDQVKIGDFSFTVLKCFDWKDRKILRLIFTEAVHHKGKFPISLKDVLEQIGELKTGGKTLNEKLEDLKSRFIRYRNVILNWEYKSGKKIDESEGGIFILNWGSYYTKSNDIIIEDLFLGKWFQVNKDVIKEFTRIPQKLLYINTHRHWLGFAIAEKMCILLRVSKEEILKKKSAYRVPIKLSIKFLLDEVLTNSEIREALEDVKKGSRLKSRILDEIKFLESHLNWQFNWIGLEDNQSFSDFYSRVSFTCHVDPELESQILGEKQIKEIKPKSKIPLTIEGDLVKALRKNLKMTQETFAKYLGYSRTLVSKIERGSEVASEDFIKTLYQKYSSEIEKIR